MRTKPIFRLIATAITALTACNSFALPARPGLLRVSQSDGTAIDLRLIGDERFHYYLTADGMPLLEKDGVYYYAALSEDGKLTVSNIKATERVPYDSEIQRRVIECLEKQRLHSYQLYNNRCKMIGSEPGNLRFGDYVTSGSPKVLVVLVEFEDVSFNTPNPKEYFTRMLSEEGFSDYGATGSVLDYLQLNSAGQFTPQFEVVGPVKVSGKVEDYGFNNLFGGGEPFAHNAVAEACSLIDDEIDFSLFDNNGNGIIDGVYVIHAGEGEATGGNPNAIWPHTSWFSVLETQQFVYDGVMLDTYSISNEISDGRPEGNGVFIHEFSHMLGLPDIYTSNKSTFTPGPWSVLDMGPYLNERRNPPLYSAFERYALGWLEPKILEEPDIIRLPSIADNVACCVKANEEEIYWFENRQKIGWDAYLPGHGMLVWHVDYTLDHKFDVNKDPEHQHIDLVEADGVLTE